MTILAAVAATYSVLAWNAAGRFGSRVLFLTWPAASVLLLAYLMVRLTTPAILPLHAYAIGAFAVFLGFGLSTRSVWSHFRRQDTSRHLSFRTIAGATLAFFLGFILGLLPPFMLDIVTMARRT